MICQKRSVSLLAIPKIQVDFQSFFKSIGSVENLSHFATLTCLPSFFVCCIFLRCDVVVSKRLFPSAQVKLSDKAMESCRCATNVNCLLPSPSFLGNPTMTRACIELIGGLEFVVTVKIPPRLLKVFARGGVACVMIESALCFLILE